MMGVDYPIPDALSAGITPTAATPSEKLLDIQRLVGEIGLDFSKAPPA